MNRTGYLLCDSRNATLFRPGYDHTKLRSAPDSAFQATGIALHLALIFEEVLVDFTTCKHLMKTTSCCYFPYSSIFSLYI
jgi:hypothetical protein